MRGSIALFAALITTQAFGTCAPVPPSWKLGMDADPSVLPTLPATQKGTYPYDAIKHIRDALVPGEKLVRYSDWQVNQKGFAGGTEGFALIRNGCLIGTYMTEAI